MIKSKDRPFMDAVIELNELVKAHEYLKKTDDLFAKKYRTREIAKKEVKKAIDRRIMAVAKFEDILKTF